ncbi:DNA-directed RNA polymerase subunit beta [Oceanobacillus sp. CAU 1775]
MATKQIEEKQTEKALNDKETKKAYQRSAKNESKKQVKAEEETRTETTSSKPVRVRIFPLWLRIIVVALITFAALIGGLMIGYGVIGDGAPLDALKVETWQHLIDIVISEN